MNAPNPNRHRNIVNRITLSSLFSILLLMPVIAATGYHGTVNLAWNPHPASNIASYKIHLGTASGEYSEVMDVGNVTGAEVSGLTPGLTYYCALQACDTDGLTSELSIEISFGISVSGVAFDEWAASGGLSGADATPSATPFHDGVPNLLKYAFNRSASGPDSRVLEKGVGIAGLPIIGLEQFGADTWFTVEFLRRKEGGLVYVPKTSNNLETFVPMAGSPIVTDIDTQWERVVIRIPCDPSVTPVLFGRVEVMLP